MKYIIEHKDGCLHISTEKSALERISSHKSFSQRLTSQLFEFTKRLPAEQRDYLLSRKDEVMPAGLRIGGSKQQISKRAKGLMLDFIKLSDKLLTEHKENMTDDLFHQFLTLNNIKPFNLPCGKYADSKLGYTSFWYNKMCRALEKASAIYDFVVEDVDKYTSDRHLNYSLSLARKGTYYDKNGKKWTYNELQALKQYQRCCSYKARSIGVADFAASQNLDAYLISVTPVSSLRDMCADDLSAQYNAGWKTFTDSLRHAELNSYNIKVIEPGKDGVPHVHALLFTDNIDRVMMFLKRAYIDKHELAGSIGVHYKPAHDVPGAINYLLKTHWGKLKYDSENADQIMLWGKHAAHRRFSITSTMHKLPSVQLWEDSRSGKAQVHKHKTYKSRLNDDALQHVKYVNNRLNEAAQSGNFFMFLKTFMSATTDEKTGKENLLKMVGTATFREGPQLSLINQDNFIQCPTHLENSSKTHDACLSLADPVDMGDCLAQMDTS